MNTTNRKYIIFLLILSLIILLVLFIFRKNLLENYINNIDNIDNIEIDIVYTWVDEYDPERVEYQKLLLNKQDFNLDPARYEQSDELKYSIRSIEQNCPWYRNIYIVVKDGQKPNFLNFDNKRIKLINHSEIMPKSSLPTFSSLSIESCIHKIKGLSDFYIYMNDDLFMTKPIAISDFIQNNLPLVNIVHGTKPKITTQDYSKYDYGLMYDLSMNLANKITRQNLQVCPTHTPSICYKPWDIELEKILKNINTEHNQNLWDYTVHSKFRKNDNAAINGCIRPIFYLYKGAKQVNYYNETKLINLDNTCSFEISNNIKFLCINKISSHCKKEFQTIMSKKFPIKSIHE